MSFYAYEIVTAAEHLPVDGCCRTDRSCRSGGGGNASAKYVFWRGHRASRRRRIFIDGELPQRLLIEPATILTLTRWVAGDDYVVIPEDSYYSVTRDPHGTIVAPNGSWPAARTSHRLISRSPTLVDFKSRHESSPWSWRR